MRQLPLDLGFRNISAISETSEQSWQSRWLELNCA